MDQLIVNVQEANQLAREGGKLVFKPEAEYAIVELYKMKRLIDDRIDYIKKRIGEAGSLIDPDFKGVIGEAIRAIYREYGDLYDFDEAKTEVLYQAGFLKKTEKYRVDANKVKEYFLKGRKLPDGITEKQREKVISLTVPENEQDSFILQPIEPVDAGTE